MLRRATMFFASAMLLAAATASASPLGYATSTTQDLYSIDFATGNATLIGSQGVFLEALAVSSSGQLFGTDTSGLLYSINTSTGAAALIGDTGLGNIEGLDFNGSTLVGTNFNDPTSFNSIDTSSAAASLLTTTSSGVIRTMAIQDSNTALALSDSPDFQTLISVNLTTGAFTNIGSVGTTGIYGIDFASNGTLYGVAGDGSLFTIDPLTGGATVIGDTGEQFWLGLAIPADTSAPVPEPASLTLLGLGLAGMAGRRWRQRKAS